VLWANLHGSVVLGAGLAVLLGLVELVRARRLERIPLALVVLSPLCVLATPYGWDIVAYYKLMLVDAPFAPILREWQWSSPSGTTALFWLLPPVALGLPALPRCRGPRARLRLRGRALPPPLPEPARDLRAPRGRGDVRRRGAGGARRDLVRPRLCGDPPRRARRRPDEGRRRRPAAQPRDLACLARGTGHRDPRVPGASRVVVRVRLARA